MNRVNSESKNLCLEPKFINFVKEKLQVAESEINSKSKLSTDFGCCGLDAVTFMQDFFKYFKIKDAEKFNYELYLDLSPDFILTDSFFKRIKKVCSKQNRKIMRREVSFNHLNKVLKAEKWFEE